MSLTFKLRVKASNLTVTFIQKLYIKKLHKGKNIKQIKQSKQGRKNKTESKKNKYHLAVAFTEANRPKPIYKFKDKELCNNQRIYLLFVMTIKQYQTK